MTIDELKDKYYTPTESVNTVYDIFKDFFNEVRVDLQVNKAFRKYLEGLLEEPSEFTLNKLSDYNLNAKLDIADFINTYYQKPPFFNFVHFPDVTITSDFIAGFPGETEEQFEETLTAIDEFELDYSNTAAYSPREKTVAAKWVDKFIPEEVKTERLKRLNDKV